MWNSHPEAETDRKLKLNDYITYFEGTCEFCIGNMGIRQYENDVDSMLLEKDTLDDETVMLCYYVQGVIRYKNGDLEDALDSWKHSQVLAEHLGDDVFLAKILSYQAIYNYVHKRFDVADALFVEARNMFESRQMYTELALHYINYLWYKRYDPDKSSVAEYMDKAFFYVKQSDSVMNARVYLHLGYIYKTIFNDFLRGIGYLTTARELCHRNNNIEMECMTLHTLADGYIQLQHNEEALEIYEAVVFGDRYRSITENLKCMILTNMIPCYLSINAYDRVEDALEKMDEYTGLTQKTIRPQFECITKWLRAELYIATGSNCEKVLPLLDECSDFYGKHPDNFQVDAFDLKLCCSYGDYYSKIGDNDEALKQYQKMEKIALSLNDYYQKQAYGRLSSCYELMKDYREALNYSKLEDKVFMKIVHSNVLSQYDRLYKQFFQSIQEEDIRNLNKERDALSKAAYTDELTRIRNKGYLQYLADSDSLQGDYGVIMFDIDFFKRYNDCYGHIKGDACLCAISAIIQISLEEECPDAEFIRYGGEEFLVIIPRFNRTAASSYTDNTVIRIHEAKIKKFSSSDDDPYLSVSAGCTCGKVSGKDDLFTLIDKADKALYQAKGAGRNRAVFLESGL